MTDLLESMRKRHQVQSLNEEEIAYILSEVCNALVYLHGHCRIHRDVKGNNILLTGEGKLEHNYIKKPSGVSVINIVKTLFCHNHALIVLQL